MSSPECQIVVVGGGIAGASVAAHLAEHATVRLLEMESQPGYHSTGRSAALFAVSYGNEVIRALSRASQSFLFAPPASFGATALVRPRPAVVFARSPKAQALEAFAAALGTAGAVERLSAAQTLEACPVLRPQDLYGAVIDRSAADINVNDLHQGYLRLLKSRGGVVSTDTEVTALQRSGNRWCVITAREQLRADIVVNAAGAWAGRLGKMAGAHEVNPEPRVRTALLVDPPAGTATESWPFMMDVEEEFYLRPEAGLLLLSPCDETPSPPCDAQPDELDVAIAVDRLERATTIEVRQVRRQWAGLRVFVPDRTPVLGFDPVAPGFFWVAALGGYGIQTAPALSVLAASLVRGRGVPADIARFGVDAKVMAPERL